MMIKVILLVIFFAVMVAVGIYSRKHAMSVDGFVLGEDPSGRGLRRLRTGPLISLQ